MMQFGACPTSSDGLRNKTGRSPQSLHWNQSLKILLIARYNSIHLTPYLSDFRLVEKLERASIVTPAVWYEGVPTGDKEWENYRQNDEK